MKKTIIYLLSTTALLAISLGSTFAQEEATNGADAVRQRVQEKLQEALTNPKAYVGTVTDKTESALQIENQEGEIQLVSTIPEETTFVRINDETENLTYEEVGLGDFIVSMGFVNENNVLEAIRVLLTPTPEKPQREIVLGQVVGVDNRILIIESSEETWNFEFPRRWKGPEIVEIEESEMVAVVGEPDDEGSLIIRTIEITSPTPTPEE